MRSPLLLALVLLSFPLTATEPNPTARQRELIEKLILLTEQDAGMKSMTDSMFKAIEKQYLADAEASGSSPERLSEAKEVYEIFRRKIATIDFGGLMHESSVRSFARHFNEQELVDLIAFYSSPTGRKSIQVMDDLMREGMENGIAILGPKIDETMKEAQGEARRLRPWRQTMTDLRTIAVAVESYAVDHNRYPAATTYAGLKTLLEKDAYGNALPEKDVWGHDYAYVVSEDGTRYRLVSAGSDGNFEWDSRRTGPAEEQLRYRDRLEDDIIFADGTFVQLPIQGKPRE
jgi:hypothetical protein